MGFMATNQDVDISARELENRTEAVALFLNRADTEASARDSIVTTCQELSSWCAKKKAMIDAMVVYRHV